MGRLRVKLSKLDEPNASLELRLKDEPTNPRVPKDTPGTVQVTFSASTVSPSGLTTKLVYEWIWSTDKARKSSYLPSSSKTLTAIPSSIADLVPKAIPLAVEVNHILNSNPGLCSNSQIYQQYPHFLGVLSFWRTLGVFQGTLLVN